MSNSEIGDTATVRETAGSIERPGGRRRGDRVVGAGRETQNAIDRASAAAASDDPIVISGPSGSGKEHLARAIHAWGHRSSGPFVVVACRAVAREQLGREIFGSADSGQEPGADEYGGALARAAGGTAFIDGIDAMDPALRQTLGKAVADGRFQREGDGATIPLRARIAVSSEEPVESPFGSQQQHTIALLPLSERTEDILPLSAHFLRLAADEEGVTPVGFTSDARAALLGEPWKGNVRELGERVRQAVKLSGGGAISAEALLLAADNDEVPSFKDAKRAFETRYVVGLLRRCGGNISRAARLAKKDRKDFYDVIRRTGVNPSEFR
jgi:two-component system response regulator GlrR